MRTQYVNSILNAVKKVFISMLDITVRFENPVTKKMYHPTYEICSIIKINGDLSGCIVLSYPKEIAITIASEMLNEKLSEINDDALDAICEIANMVIGTTDTELEMENVFYSLPNVFVDSDKIDFPKKTFIFSMPCLMDSGLFEVDIALY